MAFAFNSSAYQSSTEDFLKNGCYNGAVSRARAVLPRADEGRILGEDTL